MGGKFTPLKIPSYVVSIQQLRKGKRELLPLIPCSFNRRKSTLLMDCEQINTKVVLSNTTYVKDFSVFAAISEANVPWEGVWGELWLHSSCITRQGAFLLQAWDYIHPVSLQSIWTTALLPLSHQCSSFGVVELDIS